MRELHLSNQSKIIAGVCGGLAESLQINPLLIRLIFLALLLWGGNSLFVYILLWVILPRIDMENATGESFPLYRSIENRLIGGVCGGLAPKLRIDVNLLRLLFVIFTAYIGSGILLYLILWLLIPLASVRSVGSPTPEEKDSTDQTEQ